MAAITPAVAEPATLPGSPKSLVGVAVRAFCLGAVFVLGAALTIVLLVAGTTDSDGAGGSSISITLTGTSGGHPLWRVPFFIAALALFHFLEFAVTARFNPARATTEAFLLTSNGIAYAAAHAASVAELLFARGLLPALSVRGFVGDNSAYACAFVWPFTLLKLTGGCDSGVRAQVAIGLALMVAGQAVRSVSMAQAGTNFAHTVQLYPVHGHRLVDHGLYAVLRHPSYFGFFYWSLGTQLVLGNCGCFVLYAVVLWVFFAARIKRECAPQAFAGLLVADHHQIG